MLEILYRIYQVPFKEEIEKIKEDNKNFNSPSFYSGLSKENNIEIAMDCLICDNREQFKDIIRASYGIDIRFSYSRKYSEGTYYCIIIGEHCYNTEKYFNKLEYFCDNCKAKVTTYNHPIRFGNYDINHTFYGIDEYKDKQFCSDFCKSSYVEKELKRIRPDNDKEFFITRDMFSESVAGYIYKISKRSTGEFYIGQTIYAPIFRWGQHLKTERFDIKNILDYIFEVIEIVPMSENILEREKYYIQKFYKENPDKSLNIMQTANISSNVCIDEFF
jgi:hypothetical protein